MVGCDELFHVDTVRGNSLDTNQELPTIFIRRIVSVGTYGLYYSAYFVLWDKIAFVLVSKLIFRFDRALRIIYSYVGKGTQFVYKHELGSTSVTIGLENA